MNESARRTLIWAFTAGWYGAMTWIALITGDASGIVGFFAFPLVGAILLTSRPRNGMGRALLFGIGILDLVMGGLTQGALALDWPSWVLSLGVALSWPAWILLPFVITIFPTGRFQNRFGRALWWTAVAAGMLIGLMQLLDPSVLVASGEVNPLGVAWVGMVTPVVFPIANAVQVVVYVGVLADLVVRFARSRGAFRLQFRWLVFAACVIIPIIAVVGIVLAIDPDSTIGSTVSYGAAFVLNFIPGAILIAVTRHGLYEINRVISRTVSYAIVALLVIAAYAAIVVSFSLLLPGQNAVAVALATLAAAAVFLPLLRWIQRRLDRAFDRERYDAQQVVEAFGERVRTDIDPATTAPELIEAVQQTLQPSSVGIWTTRDRR